MATPIQPIIDKKAIVKQLKEQLAALDALQPHINTAQQAFGGFEEHQAQLTTLKNQINKAIAAYSA